MSAKMLSSRCIYFASVLSVLVAAAPKHGKAPLILMNDGQCIPQLAFGTYLGIDRNGFIKPKEKEVRQAVEWAIDAGYRHIDTAAFYGIEDQVGEAINNKIKDGTIRRKDMFVTTKLWNDKHARDQVVPALRESLQRLSLNYVDMFLIHFPTAYTTEQEIQNIDPAETWQGMEEAANLGLTRSIGLSNFNESQIERLWERSEIKPALLETEVHPNLTEEKLVNYAKGKGMVVMAYSPFGFLIPSRSSKDTPAPKIDDPTLEAIGKKYGKTTPQVVLRYLVDRGLIPIPKSFNKGRLEQNIDIFDFALTPEEIHLIDSFNQNRRIIVPTFWQDHPEFPFEKSDTFVPNFFKGEKY